MQRGRRGCPHGCCSVDIYLCRTSKHFEYGCVQTPSLSPSILFLLFAHVHARGIVQYWKEKAKKSVSLLIPPFPSIYRSLRFCLASGVKRVRVASWRVELSRSMSAVQCVAVGYKRTVGFCQFKHTGEPSRLNTGMSRKRHELYRSGDVLL